MHHTIDVTDLHFAYPDGHEVLCGISFRIEPNERVALVGPNGAGKSTLLLHLNGILRGRGIVKVCGTTVDDATIGQVRASVGLVFQDPDDQLFSPTVEEDVAFGPLHMRLPPDEVRRRTKEALAAVGLAGYERRLSHHLSGGEKKRAAIATVLSMQPEILVLDEPTAGLDPRARRSFIRLLAELPMTMLVSTHDLSMAAEVLPRILILDEGLLLADGPTSQILSDKPLLEKHGLLS
jgi:cobalt/nickel transport system ATP-binding protein